MTNRQRASFACVAITAFIAVLPAVARPQASDSSAPSERTDSGHRAFNYSEFLGNATAAGLSDLYSPRESRSLGDNAFTFAEQLSIDALSNELREFWPDIHRKVFSRHKTS